MGTSLTTSEFSAFVQSLPKGTFNDIRALFFIVRDKKYSSGILKEVDIGQFSLILFNCRTLILKL